MALPHAPGIRRLVCLCGEWTGKLNLSGLTEGVFGDKLRPTLSSIRYSRPLNSRDPTEPKFAPIPDRPYHDRRYHIDFSKVKEAMKWECTTPFHEGLAKTVEFYVNEYNDEQKSKLIMERPQG